MGVIGHDAVCVQAVSLFIEVMKCVSDHLSNLRDLAKSAPKTPYAIPLRISRTIDD